MFYKFEELEGGSVSGSIAVRKGSRQSQVVIFGAGAAGRQLAIGLGQGRECALLAFVDDWIELQGRDLMGVPVISQDKLQAFVVNHQVDDILLAMPSINRKQRSIIIERLRPLNVRIRTLPGIAAMAKGSVDYSDLNELDLNDLLSREPAEPDEEMLQEQVAGNIIMVTGAGGSIGSELCRQVLRRNPKVLLLFELNELLLYNLHNELLSTLGSMANRGGSVDRAQQAIIIIPLLGSVVDESRVKNIVLTWRPDIIYYTAAVKHVPIAERNISECVKVNVLGTLTMAKLAIEFQVKSFILVSTDKAVNPTSTMGATKRCCELILQALAAERKPSFEPILGDKPSSQVTCITQLAIVRFGNVLGSSGSVVPYFREQISQGGPITLTHQDIIRYFMTIPEAAQLVMQAASMLVGSASSGEANVYILDMGEPVKIYDLACRMIELSGYRVKDESSPEGDIAIDIIGLRPGEKLYEELLIGHNPQSTQHPRIMKASEIFLPWSELQPMLFALRTAVLNGDVMLVRSTFKLLVSEYQPSEKVIDLVYQEQMDQTGNLVS